MRKSLELEEKPKGQNSEKGGKYCEQRCQGKWVTLTNTKINGLVQFYKADIGNLSPAFHFPFYTMSF